MCNSNYLSPKSTGNVLIVGLYLGCLEEGTAVHSMIRIKRIDPVTPSLDTSVDTANKRAPCPLPPVHT